MIATSTCSPHHLYMPPRPSPLSPRSANAAPRPLHFSMATSAQNENYLGKQRTYKPNPVVQTRDAATKRRRDMFFKRVQKGRDDKKWDARGEQIQRLDYMSEKKRWEAEKARQAPQMDDDMVAPEWEEPASSMPELEMMEADYVLAQEEREMQELIASLEEEDNKSQHYGSDDEDYDQLFMEFAMTIAPQEQQQPAHNASTSTHFQDEDAMDMS